MLMSHDSWANNKRRQRVLEKHRCWCFLSRFRMQILSFHLSVDEWVLSGPSDLFGIFIRSYAQNAPSACPPLLYPTSSIQFLSVFSSSSPHSAQPQWSIPGRQLPLRAQPTIPNHRGGPQCCHSTDQLHWRGMSFHERGGACLETLLMIGCIILA